MREKRDATTSETGYNQRESSSKTADEDHPKTSEEKKVTSKRKESLELLSGNAANSGMAGRLRRASDIAKKIRRSSGTNIDQTSSQTSQSVAPKTRLSTEKIAAESHGDMVSKNIVSPHPEPLRSTLDRRNSARGKVSTNDDRPHQSPSRTGRGAPLRRQKYMGTTGARTSALDGNPRRMSNKK